MIMMRRELPPLMASHKAENKYSAIFKLFSGHFQVEMQSPYGESRIKSIFIVAIKL